MSEGATLASEPHRSCGRGIRTRSGHGLLFALLLGLLVALVSSPSTAHASEANPTVDEVAEQVMCPTCDAPLNQSDGPAADRMREYIQGRIDAGWTKQQIIDGLVVEYGSEGEILAAPRAEGRGLVAWVVPFVVFALAVAFGMTRVVRRRRTAEGGSANPLQ